MIEVKATFPKRDNTGIPFRSSMFRHVEGILLDMVGGYTVTECSGGWVDDLMKEYTDHSYVYSVVVDDMNKATKVMSDLKWILLNEFGQKCAWITYSDINIF